jgi:hypothetical protein
VYVQAVCDDVMSDQIYPAAFLRCWRELEVRPAWLANFARDFGTPQNELDVSGVLTRARDDSTPRKMVLLLAQTELCCQPV